MVSTNILMLFAMYFYERERRKRKLEEEYEAAQEAPVRIDLDDLPEPAITMFRYDVDQIRTLATELGFPERVKAKYVRGRGIEALCILLRKLTYPCDFEHLTSLFGRSPSKLRKLFNYALDFIYDKYHHLLDMSTERLLKLKPKMPSFAEAVSSQGAPLKNIFMILDDTRIQVSEPELHQEELSDGEGSYCLSFLNFSLPNGIIFASYGPEAGAACNCGLWYDSNAEQCLEEALPNREFVLYGDSSFEHVNSPYLHTQPIETDDETSKHAIPETKYSLEWVNGTLMSEWEDIEDHEELNDKLTAVEKLYAVSVLLTNFLTCLEGQNEIGFKFGTEPPTLSEYLNEY
ncbi:hypothetical protein MP638_004202 [Amoeboaphelidium occidentale]|nr:hypothetical protein MP638_004202 [Amoeboaphelidium occidentale]